jgi:hypothetical protein
MALGASAAGEGLSSQLPPKAAAAARIAMSSVFFRECSPETVEVTEVKLDSGSLPAKL